MPNDMSPEGGANRSCKLALIGGHEGRMIAMQSANCVSLEEKDRIFLSGDVGLKSTTISAARSEDN
jgi:hypothetical protein